MEGIFYAPNIFVLPRQMIFGKIPSPSCIYTQLCENAFLLPFLLARARIMVFGYERILNQAFDAYFFVVAALKILRRDAKRAASLATLMT